MKPIWSRFWGSLSLTILLAWAVGVLMAGCAAPQAAAPKRAMARPARSIQDQARSLRPIRPLAAQALEASRQARPPVAVHIPTEVLPDSASLNSWVQALIRSGVTAIILDIGTQERDQDTARSAGGLPRGVYFRTGWAETVRDAFGELVPVAHTYGLSVWASVSLRRMNWVDPGLGWNDAIYDPLSAEFRPSRNLDLFHPAFQEYLAGLFSDLAATNLDGVLFLSEPALGPKEGLSVYARRGFERAFRISLAPERLYPVPDHATSPAREPAKDVREGARRQGGNGQGYPREFWQWVGWKAREALKVIERLRHVMKTQAPGLRFALEVHPEAVSDPVRALVQYGEDLLEAKKAQFDVFVTQGGPFDSATGGRQGGLIARMIDLLGGPERIWLTTPLPRGDPMRLADRLNPASDRSVLNEPVGLIYVEAPPPIP